MLIQAEIIRKQLWAVKQKAVNTVFMEDLVYGPL